MMKIFVATLALAAASFAAPSPGKGVANQPVCTPGTYSCAPGGHGWLVCNTSSQWVNGGDCPPKTDCVYYKPSLSVYCVPPGFQFP